MTESMWLFGFILIVLIVMLAFALNGKDTAERSRDEAVGDLNVANITLRCTQETADTWKSSADTWKSSAQHTLKVLENASESLETTTDTAVKLMRFVEHKGLVNEYVAFAGTQIVEINKPAPGDVK